jgi:hypothetical protein
MADSKPLKNNRNLDFVDRVLRPEKYTVVNNPDGSVSTHKMSSGEIGGKQIVYPTIVNVDNKLKDLGPREAIRHADKTGEYIQFKTQPEAEKFGSTGYKEAATAMRPQTSAAAPGTHSLAPPMVKPPIPRAKGGCVKAGGHPVKNVNSAVKKMKVGKK